MIRFILLGFLGIAAWGWLAFAIYQAMHRPVTYDCSMSVFHPDYPKGVKKQCKEKSK